MKKRTIVVILILLIIYLIFIIYYNLKTPSNNSTNENKIENGNTNIQDNTITTWPPENFDENIILNVDTNKIDIALSRGQTIEGYINENPSLYPEKLVSEFRKLLSEATAYSVDFDEPETEQVRIDELANKLGNVVDKLFEYVPKDEETEE